LLQMLAGHVASGDPDLQPRYNGDSPYKRMILFVLRHSDQLLSPEDSATLLLRQDEVFGLVPGGPKDPFSLLGGQLARHNLTVSMPLRFSKLRWCISAGNMRAMTERRLPSRCGDVQASPRSVTFLTGSTANPRVAGLHLVMTFFQRRLSASQSAIAGRAHS